MRILERKEADVEVTTIDIPEVEATDAEPVEAPSPAPVRSLAGFEFELPIGYLDEDGCIHRTAVLRKMTGRDEAIMADRRNRNSAARMMTELLASCLARLGSIEQPGVRVVQSLYSSDRYFLLLRLREITFGSDLSATYACPTCKESVTLVEDLSQLEVMRLEPGQLPDDIVVDLDDGYLDRDGSLHTKLILRHPTGVDEEKISAAARENPSHGKNALMARCVVALGNIPRPRLEALGTSLFNDLTLGDRARIDEALNQRGPGIDMRHEVACPSCGREYEVTLDLSNFLRPS
jgi:hypothetical protein